jgi:hypothetical protein
MTDPFELPDWIVQGQRARAQSPFADLSWPTRGNIMPEEPLETSEGDPNTGGAPLSDEALQCADPDSRREWN